MYAPVRRFYESLKVGNLPILIICKNTRAYLNPTITGGVSPYSYEWYKNGEIIDSQYSHGATYRTPVADAIDAASGTTTIYKLVVTDSVHSIAQNEFIVQVPPTLAIGDIPDQYISPNESVTLAPEIIGETDYLDNGSGPGSAALSYQWSRNGAPLSEATNPTYTTPTSDAVAGTTNRYRLLVTSPCGTRVAKLFIVYVIEPLSITLSSTQTCPGTAVTLNPVVSGGVTPYTYQWYKNNTLISGANSATYTTLSADSVAGSSTMYKVVVTDARSQTVNKMAAVSVPATLTISNGETWNILPNGTVNFYPNITGGKLPFTYQWYKNDVAIANATGGTYTTDSADAVGGSTNVYKLVVTDDCGNTVLCENTVNVIETLTVTQLFTEETLRAGLTVNIRPIISGGTKPYTRTWYKDDVPFSAGTAYTTPSSEAIGGVTHVYKCVITDTNANANSGNPNAPDTTQTATAIWTVNWFPNVTIDSIEPMSVQPGTMVQIVPEIYGGVEPYTYKWYKENVTISGATEEYYTVPQSDTVSGSTLHYTLQVTDAENYSATETFIINVL